MRCVVGKKRRSQSTICDLSRGDPSGICLPPFRKTCSHVGFGPVPSGFFEPPLDILKSKRSDISRVDVTVLYFVFLSVPDLTPPVTYNNSSKMTIGPPLPTCFFKIRSHTMRLKKKKNSVGSNVGGYGEELLFIHRICLI